ncbi:MAG: PHP domain-containing protein [Spirochaetota bacterium]
MTVPFELNAPRRDARLAALAEHVEANTNGLLNVPLTDEVNNHVHTTYSFSPYSPTAAAWMARSAGLRAVGSVDHDSIAAAPETLEACRIIGMGSTVGCEVRVNFSGTPLEGRKINNPDSENLAYIVFHGVPASEIERVDAFLAPIRERRNERNRVQTEAMSRLLEEADAPSVSFDEVVGCSNASEGGGITERHILYAASRSLMEWMQPGPPLRRFVEERLSGALPSRLASFLDDPVNPHYVYDLLGALKSSFLPRFFVQPDETECIAVEQAVAFANSIEAIPAYAYLGDIEDSPTGDKKAARFEDAYLDELFDVITGIGFRAVTYMPPRNTLEQLQRVQRLCASHGLMEISGVDINSSRQAFTCPEILRPEFRHLIDATWALIAHEKLTTIDRALSLFCAKSPVSGDLAARIAVYARIGRRIDPHHPELAREAAGL